MTNERKQEFTRKISNSNRTGLILVLYEMFFEYIKDAKEARKSESWEIYKNAVRQADAVLRELSDVLNFQYELSKDLYQIYTYCRRRLAVAMYRRTEEELNETEIHMNKLYGAFQEVAQQDTSEVLMKNTQKVYAGMTYQKGVLAEDFQDPERSRGFFA